METPEENNPFIVESERAYAVYDSESGEIVHVHVVTQFRGGTPWPDGHEEPRALTMAERMGHNPKRLRVMRVDPAEVEYGTQRVDLATMKLVPREEQNKSRES